MRAGIAMAALALGWLPSVNGAREKSVGPKRPAPAPGKVLQGAVTIGAVKAEARAVGARLLARLQAGALTLVNRDRDLRQFRSLAGEGCLCGAGGKPVSISVRLIQMLDRLSARATKQHPLTVMSLYREPRAGRTTEPHANGLAVDVAAYLGRRIDNRDPKQTEAAVVGLVESLGPGDYRLGLPKPPGANPVAFGPTPPQPKSWPFLPAPLAVALPLWSPGLGISLVLPDPHSRAGAWKPWVVRWANERGAPVKDVGSAAVRAAIRRAARRGATVYAVFPDAADHLHVDVAPPPGESKGPAVTFACCGD